ncbi:MAG: formate dehydrogenase accessory protein FdhE [Blastocatellia bacterium]|nr:formate dehydrogenase accessory protein FdhE [Blastocatellia bacterium]
MAIKFSWRQRIERAQLLAAEAPHAREIMRFYAEILEWQADLFSRLSEVAQKNTLSGAFESDHGLLLESFGSLLNLTREKGSQALAAQVDEVGADEADWKKCLSAWWNGESDFAQVFFARVCLQPYLELLAQTGAPPFDSKINACAPPRLEVAQPRRDCPFCGRKPQLALLSDALSAPGPVDDAVEGGKRFLMCGDCMTIWPFQRIACPNCPETDPRKLPYYSAEEFPSLRVESCDSCKRYLKAIDMTRDRRPVPIVDELAAIPLDLWAWEQNYIKIQPNLAGI